MTTDSLSGSCKNLQRKQKNTGSVKGAILLSEGVGLFTGRSSGRTYSVPTNHHNLPNIHINLTPDLIKKDILTCIGADHMGARALTNEKKASIHKYKYCSLKTNLFTLTITHVCVTCELNPEIGAHADTYQ